MKNKSENLPFRETSLKEKGGSYFNFRQIVSNLAFIGTQTAKEKRLWL
jgi:hypothetical protein